MKTVVAFKESSRVTMIDKPNSSLGEHDLSHNSLFCHEIDFV